MDELLAKLALLEAEERILNLRRSALSAKIESAKTALREICTHEKTRTESRYFSGGYYDRARTEHTKICETCGKTVGAKTEMHNYYG